MADISKRTTAKNLTKKTVMSYDTRSCTRPLCTPKRLKRVNQSRITIYCWVLQFQNITY